MLRPNLAAQGRALWPLYPVRHSFLSRAQPHENLPVPGQPAQETVTGWSPWTGTVGLRPPSLEPAYGTFYDSSPNGFFGGGPGGGVQMGPGRDVTATLILDPARAAEATPGLAPVLPAMQNPSMDYAQPPSFGQVAWMIPAGGS